jgi:hypothetical protein
MNHTKLWDKTLYRSDDHYAIAPGICRAHNGTILVGFRRNPNRKKSGSANLHIDADSHVALIRSHDDGQTWSDAQQLPHPGIGVTGLQAADFTVLKSGRILLPTFQWTHHKGKQVEDVGGPHYFTRHYQKWTPNFPYPDAFEMTGPLIAHSDDNGQTFSPWRPIGQAPAPNHQGRFAVQGTCAQLPDGTVLLPGYSQIHGTPGGLKASAYTALTMASKDHGLTWDFHSQVTRNKDPRGQGFDEHSLLYHPTGELLSLHRATFDPDDTPWVSRSFDNGKSWTLHRLNGVVGHPVKGIVLSDGRTLIVYGYRHAPQGGVRFRILTVGSTDIAGASEQILCDNALSGTHKVDESVTSDYGYPGAVEVSPGVVLIVYYFPDPSGSTQIRGAMIQV